MGENSKIQWTDHTFNPWTGCTKVSPGCANCYAEGWAKRSGLVEWGPGKARRRTSASIWKQPLKWNAQQAERYLERGAGEPIPDRPRVFCASLADWLDDDGVPIEWLRDLLILIHATPNLDWLLLSKRPHLWRSRIEAAYKLTFDDGRPWLDLAAWLEGNPPANVWIGTTVEDQQRADERIPLLAKIPARVRFLSCEPLLGPVDLGLMGNMPGRITRDYRPTYTFIHWVIAGGESGPGARPCDLDHIGSLRDQCKAAGVAFFAKQLGRIPVFMSGREILRIKTKDGHGGDWDEWPAELRVRQFPNQEVTP